MTDHSFLTAFSPIEYRRNDPDEKLAKIKALLASHEQDNSPFKACPMVHMVRLQVIERLTPPMGDVSGKNLKTRYLLFVADIDGGVDDFLDCLYRKKADFVQGVWGRCLGYPDYEGAVFFRRYIHRCQFKNPLGYAGFPSSVQDILKATARKQRLSEWVHVHQDLDDSGLQHAWRSEREKLINPDIPKPGDL